MTRLLAVLAGLAMLATVVDAVAQQPIVVKFSHVVAKDTPKGRAALYLKTIVEKRTKGQVKVEIHPDSRLYNDANELAALQRGDVQMLAPSLAKFGPLGVREFEVFDLPYLFDSYAEVHRVVLGPIGSDLLKQLEPHGIVGLTYWDNGFKQMSANRPLKGPADLKGLKMRVQASAVLQAQMRALGAIPEVIDFSETFAALKSGKVDGTENPASNFYSQRMQDVQKHLTVTSHGYLGYAVIVNKKFWDGLPADLRRTFTEALREATIFANDIASEANNDALDAIARSGKTQVARLSPRERAEWRRALAPVHREMEGKIGKDLIRAIYRETGFDPEKQ